MNPREQAARLEKVYKARRLPSPASIAEIKAAVAAIRAKKKETS